MLYNSIKFALIIKIIKMKNLINIISCFLLLILASCSTQIYMEPSKVVNAVEANEFNFEARSVYPTNLEVMNVMNSIPGGSSGRMMKLDSGYGIKVNKDELTVNLPYYGRLFNATNAYTNKNSLDFTSKEFTITKNQNKKGNWLVTINVKDQNTQPKFIFEIFKSGSVFVSASLNDRNPISYDGYLID